MMRRQVAVNTTVAVAFMCIFLGAFFGGNLFRIVTSEYPGPGPGYGQTNTSIHVDSTVTMNTRNPEAVVTGFWRFAPGVQVWLWDNVDHVITRETDGSFTILLGHHAGVLTTLGLNWLEDQIGDSPGTAPAGFISLSTSASGPSAAWTIIPTEIKNGGLVRKAAAYTSTGNGAWTEVHQFTANATHTGVQLMGVNWVVTKQADNTLLCADTFTPVNLNAADKITATMAFAIS